jgi:16S rRNA processing protein RimM
MGEREKDKKNGKEELIIAGKLHKTHGLWGDLKVEVYPPNFKFPEKVYIKDDKGNFKELEVQAYSKKKGLIKFKGYDDIDKAKKIKHRYFYVEKSQLPELNKDEFYTYELIDMDVYSGDKYIGKVINVDDRLATAYLLIKCSDDKVRHLPFINEFVKEIDKENKKIFVELPEGWLEL